MRGRRDPGENIARNEAHGNAVRVVDDDGIVDLKSEGRSHRRTRLNCAPDF
jgi:hypothetical protein